MKNKKKSENYLLKVPSKNPSFLFSQDENGIVTLEIENKGAMNRVFQRLFKKPKISYIHLDEMGSFIWLLIDGEKDIIKIGEEVKEHFKEKAEPLYERLSKYIKILESYSFITFK